MADLIDWLLDAPPEVTPTEREEVDDDPLDDPDDDDDERIDRLRDTMPVGSAVGSLDPDYHWWPYNQRCHAADGDYYDCTLLKGHAGDHVCHGGGDWTDEILARWPQFPAEVEVSHGL